MKFPRDVLVWWFGGALGLVAMLGEPVQAAPPRVGIMRFAGKGETDVRVAVTRAVGTHGFALVGARALEEARGAHGKAPTSKEAVAAMAKELHLAAVIDGRVELERGAGTARIAVRDPRDGSIIANESWSVRKKGEGALAQSVGKTFWKRLGPALAKATGQRDRATPAARKARHRQR
jgi:hypothetical protein